ncbi:phosphoinositide phospholipase C 1 [Arabidopsis lyrata subsp. lyrata]|uniref:phosphoinositide phospholipase C 1 n=1 Tax=Arabidopsis lyrata subsp. lyrata TaxID=81972 RepID=UPI000A29A842|nr:phosphoinositide phospholipase C 1 [Arabidopsis lyrata subsp. lyrata]|eukprot:XP_020881831.1 phosphoinositide phospholipase C 1 [Arabidopsis lyrata subsp. lyrata]
MWDILIGLLEMWVRNGPTGNNPSPTSRKYNKTCHLYGSHRYAEELVQEKDEESAAIEYRDLISIHVGNHKGGLKNCLNGDPNRDIRLSMSEQWLETLAKTRGPDLVKFTQWNLLRIYPKTTRFDSYNYDPLVGSIHGAQTVVFNMQIE